MNADVNGEPDPDQIFTRSQFGAALTRIRDRAGLTVREVATYSKLPVSTVGDYFAGAHLPPVSQPQVLERILQACDIAEAVTVQRWHAALRRARRSSARRPASAPIPYRGLATFEASDTDWFFGRDALTTLLFDRVQDVHRAGGGILVVVGPSGAGKSSLLNAGLVARLRSGGGAAEPVRVTLPSASLPQQIAETAMGTVLILDQCEEIFTSALDTPAYLTAIRAAAGLGDQPRGVTMVLGVRADFYGNLMHDAVLARALQDAQIVVGPMTDDELRAAIVEPARMAGATVEDGLVEVLLNDFAPRRAIAAGAHEPGALPLLSHALLTTWESGTTPELTLQAYRRTGGVHGAVAATAEAVYDSLAPMDRELARRIFLNLVTVSGDGPDTRRRVRHTELLGQDADVDRAAVGEALDRFVDRRLITVEADEVWITHEAVLSAWPRLREWIAADRADLRVRHQVDVAAETWDREGREAGLLLTGARLAAAREWADSGHRTELGGLAADFLNASLRHQRRSQRRLYQVIAALTVLLLVAAGSAAYAYRQRSINLTERNLALSRLVASRAEQVRHRDPNLAMQLSLASYRVAPTAEARASLLASSAGEMPTRLLASAGVLQSIAISPDGTTLAAGGIDGHLHLWDLHDAPPRRIADVAGDPGETLYALAFSADGRFLAGAGANGIVHRWSVDAPGALTPIEPALTGPRGLLYSLDFSHDGSLLAAGGVDRLVHLWHLRGRAARYAGSLAGATSYVQAVRFAPDATMLAAGSDDKTVLLWDLHDPDRPRPAGPPLGGFGQRVYSVAFSPDGRTLAAGSAEGLTQLFDLADHTPTVRIGPGGTAPSSWINALAFSPDGKTLAIACADARIWMWDTHRHAFTRMLPHPGPVTAIGYTADGRRLVSSAADGQARLWPVPGPAVAAGGIPVNSVTFSPDSRSLAVASDVLQVGPVADHGRMPALPVATSFAGAVAYADDGRLLAVGAKDGTLRWWRTTDPPTPAGEPIPMHHGMIETISIYGHLMATGGNDNEVRLWDITDPLHPASLYAAPPFASYVYSVAFSDDGTLLAAASTDNTVRVWDVHATEAPAELRRLSYATYALSVAFAPGGRWLAVGDADHTLHLYDLADPSNTQTTALSSRTGYVYALAYTPDGRTLASANTDGSLWLWNVTDPRRPDLLATISTGDQALYTIAFAPDGHTLAAAGAARQVWLWNTDLTQTANLLCTQAGDPITPDEWSQYATGVPYQPPCTKR